MTNVQKYKLIETMSKAFSAKEIAERTGFSLNTIYHFRRKYNLPNEKETEQKLALEALEYWDRKRIEAKAKALEEALAHTRNG